MKIHFVKFYLKIIFYFFVDFTKYSKCRVYYKSNEYFTKSIRLRYSVINHNSTIFGCIESLYTNCEIQYIQLYMLTFKINKKKEYKFKVLICRGNARIRTLSITQKP